MSTLCKTSSLALLALCELTSLPQLLAGCLILIKCLNLTITLPLLGNTTEHHPDSDETRHARSTVCQDPICKHHPRVHVGTESQLPKSCVCGCGFRMTAASKEWIAKQGELCWRDDFSQEIKKSLEKGKRATSLSNSSSSMPVSFNVRESHLLSSCFQTPHPPLLPAYRVPILPRFSLKFYLAQTKLQSLSSNSYLGDGDSYLTWISHQLLHPSATLNSLQTNAVTTFKSGL